MTKEETHKIFTKSFPKGEPIYWWYPYEDAAFRSQFDDGDIVRYFVKHSQVKGGAEYELFKKNSNMLMDSICDLNKVLITKEDYENFPRIRPDYMRDEWIGK